VDAHRDFTGDGGSPASVRWFVSQVLEDWGIEVGPTRDEALLLATELATNAVQHTGDGFTVAIRMARHKPETLRVEVHDRGSTLPRMREPDRFDEGGRGLLFVDRLASTWGIEPEDGGKVVWFELRLR
jgi:anti-sigma regulatory factor (Ser/Thr protein kinase)